VNKETRGKVFEGEAKFFASLSERRKTLLRKAGGVSFLGSFAFASKK